MTELRTTVVLDSEDQELLEALAQRLKCSKMEAIRRAIRHAHRSELLP